MTFYQNIYKYYEKIFPLNLKQVKFVKSLIPFDGTVLEVGSAKGYLTNALNQYYTIRGIDLDEVFVIASRKLFPQISFECMNMLNISNEIDDNSLDGIICFGNTLVHLKNEDEIKSFLYNCYSILKMNGVLTIQIINYDRILDKKINYLPTIKNNEIEFIRNYKIRGNNLEFNTVLKVEETKEEVSNSILLYPIKKNDLERLLLQTGFTNIIFLSGFESNEYDENKIPLIVTCSK